MSEDITLNEADMKAFEKQMDSLFNNREFKFIWNSMLKALRNEDLIDEIKKQNRILNDLARGMNILLKRTKGVK